MLIVCFSFCSLWKIRRLEWCNAGCTHWRPWALQYWFIWTVTITYVSSMQSYTNAVLLQIFRMWFWNCLQGLVFLCYVLFRAILQYGSFFRTTRLKRNWDYCLVMVIVYHYVSYVKHALLRIDRLPSERSAVLEPSLSLRVYVLVWNLGERADRERKHRLI